MTDFENNQAPQQPYAPVQPQAPYQPAAPVAPQAPYQAPVQQAPYAPVQPQQAPYAPVQPQQAPYQAPVQQAPFQAPQQAQMPAANKPKSKLPMLIGVVAVVAVVVILAVTLLGGSGYKKAVETVVGCWLEYETDNIEDILPAVLWEEWADEADMDVDEIVEEYKENIEEEKDWADEYGEEITYEIGKYEKMDKDDLEDLKEDIADNYDCIDEDDIGNKAYTVEIEYERSYSYEGEEETYDDDIELCVIKIDGEWYVVSEEGWFFAD